MVCGNITRNIHKKEEIIRVYRKLPQKKYIQPQNFKKQWYLMLPKNYFPATLTTLSTFLGPFVITSIATYCRYMMESTLLQKPIP